MGLLDDVFNSPQGQLGIGLLAAAGPSFTPMGIGQRLAQAQDYMRTQKEAEMRQKLQEQQMQTAQLGMSATQQQMAMQKQQMEAAAAELQQKQLMRDLASRFATPASAAQGAPVGDKLMPGNDIFSTGYKGGAAIPAKPAGFDYQGYANALAGVDPAAALKLQAELKKDIPVNKLDVKDFTPASVQKFLKTGDYGDLERLEKAQFQNTGGATLALNPFTGQTLTSIKNTQSPDSAASNAVQWANYGVSRDRLKHDQLQADKPQWIGDLGAFANPRTQVVMPPVDANGKPVEGIGKPMTDAQSKALLFGTRMKEADKIINSLANDGTTRPGLIKQSAEAVPVVGGVLGAATNWTQSSQQQMAEQAERDFLNAVLRRESGAVIGKEEFDNGKRQYFPQVGDNEDVLKQKARNRQLATELILSEAPKQQQRAFSSDPPQSVGGSPTMRWNPKTKSIEMVQ